MSSLSDVGIRNIDDVRNFAAYLRNLGAGMSDEFENARARMITVNEGWDDVENARFMEEFEQSVNLIHRISEQMERYSEFIMRKVEIIDMYKSTRL